MVHVMQCGNIPINWQLPKLLLIPLQNLASAINNILKWIMEIEMFNFLFINNNYNVKFYLPQVWRVSRLNWECPFPGTTSPLINH